MQKETLRMNFCCAFRHSERLQSAVQALDAMKAWQRPDATLVETNWNNGRVLKRGETLGDKGICVEKMEGGMADPLKEGFVGRSRGHKQEVFGSNSQLIGEKNGEVPC